MSKHKRWQRFWSRLRRSVPAWRVLYWLKHRKERSELLTRMAWYAEAKGAPPHVVRRLNRRASEWQMAVTPTAVAGLIKDAGQGNDI